MAVSTSFACQVRGKSYAGVMGLAGLGLGSGRDLLAWYGRDGGACFLVVEVEDGTGPLRQRTRPGVELVQGMTQC